MRRKNGDTSHENIVDLLCCLPHSRCRRNDLGLNSATFQFPATEMVYRRLIESDHRPQWTADEVEFVLDDQIRGPDRRDVLDCRSRQTLISTMCPAAIGIRPKKSVPWAIGRGSPEKRPNIAAPRHQCELVDCRDHHRRRPEVNFFVDDHNRNAWMRFLARFPLRELAAS